MNSFATPIRRNPIQRKNSVTRSLRIYCTVSFSLIRKFNLLHKIFIQDFSDILFHIIIHSHHHCFLVEAAQNCSLFVGPQTIVEYKNEMQEVLRATKQRYRKGKKHVVSEENSEKGEDEFDEEFDEDSEEAEKKDSYEGVDADTEDI